MFLIAPGSITDMRDPMRDPTIFNTNEIVMKKRVLSLRDRYDIEDRAGNKLAEAEGKLVEIPAKFLTKDPRTGTTILRIEGMELSLRNQFSFLDDHDQELGIMKKIKDLDGEHFSIERNGSELLHIYGDFLQHDYGMRHDQRKVARVHCDWSPLSNQYGISILGEVDHRLVIGVAIVIDQIEDSER